MKRNYVVYETYDPYMSLGDLAVEVKTDTVNIGWQWPRDPSIRLALVFPCEEEAPVVQDLIDTGRHHDVVARDLASSFATTLQKNKQKFLICPAFFDPQRNIAVCTNAQITDWLHKKSQVTASVTYSPIPLGQYKKAHITVDPATVNSAAITYAIQTGGYHIDTYPLDTAIMETGGDIYIKKDQTIKFLLNPDFDHLLELIEGE